MSKNINQSPSKGKGVGRKDRELLKQKHRRQLQEIKLLQQRQQAKAQIQKLKQTGLVSAYEQFLRNICKNGLPQPANIYELAAQFVLKFEKKHRMKLQKKQELQRHNKQLLQNSVNFDTINQIGEKSSNITTQNLRK